MRTTWKTLGYALAAGLLAVPPSRAANGPDGPEAGQADLVTGAALRPLSTDRPDVTESPFTIDPGHVQLEFDFANYTRSQLDGARTEEWGVVPFNLRLGVFSNFEAGLFVEPFTHRTDTPRGGPSQTFAGFGDVTLRGKVNFWGNDGGGTAFGLIVDLTLPTGAHGLGDDKVEGTVFLPVQFEIGGGWDLSAMTAMQLRPGTTGASKVVWINSASFGHDLAKDVSGYLELTSTAGDGTHVATGDAGLAWKLNANTQLDLGANFGLTRRADDLLVFTGISRRY